MLIGICNLHKLCSTGTKRHKNRGSKYFMKFYFKKTLTLTLHLPKYIYYIDSGEVIASSPLHLFKYILQRGTHKCRSDRERVCMYRNRLLLTEMQFRKA